MLSVLIAGLGSLGGRYLEGLSRVPGDFFIDVIEPSADAFKAGLALVSPRAVGDFHVAKKSITEISEFYDLIIVATPSAPRLALIQLLTQRTQGRNWLIEKVVAQSQEQVEEIAVCLAGSSVWVNTPRRLTDLYRCMKRVIRDAKTIKFEVYQRAFSLGCNSIHFLDVIEWLVDDILTNVEISPKSDWYPAKRPGYFEFALGSLDKSK